MAKRMTATDKWSDQWFRKLSPTLKLGYLYLLDACDCAGVIELDRDLANFQIGTEVDWDSLKLCSEGRIQTIERGRLWLTKFIEFQYGADLSEACNAHKAVIKSLRRHGLFEGSLNPSCTLREGTRTETETKTKTKGGVGGKTFRRPTVDEVAAYCHDRRNGIDAAAFWDHYDAKGWKIGKTPMKDWQAAVRTWEAKRREDSTANVEVGCDPPAMRTTNPEKLRKRGQG